MSEQTKAVRIWSADRQTKKSVVVRSLQELKKNGRTKLNIEDANITVCLENDGTVVEDEEYFQSLKDHTVLLILKSSEIYKKPWEIGHDETDFLVSAGASSGFMENIVRCLRNDFTKLITFSDTELQALVDSDTEDLRTRLLCSYDEAERIQQTCQRLLDERTNAKEALAAVKFFTQAQSEHSEQTESIAPSTTANLKRKKKS